MIYAMVVLGGVTRLTGSGLSMVQWDPLFGIVPPLNQDEWHKVFDLYKQSPEYNKINIGMDVEGFKRIYWYEFAHRLLGRSIGVVFFVPFLFFLTTGRIRRGLTPKLIVLFVLGGLQGLLGWYMVKSGLVDNPHVSQYRLTAHLALAVVIYAYMFWLALGLVTDNNPGGTPAAPRGLRLFTGLAGGLVFITMLSGGFVAGLKAGFAYNTFPLMEGRWIPDDLLIQSPPWRNFFENVATVQFDHRVLAIVTFATIVSLWLTASMHRLPAAARSGLHFLLAAAILQVTLGIMTLLLRVPVALGAAHQAGALLLLTASLYAGHRMKNT
jgi:cytochrome c oxidase assembly protein subunit 15